MSFNSEDSIPISPPIKSVKHKYMIRSSSINLNTDLNNELELEQTNKNLNDSIASNKARLYINVESKIDNK